MNNKLNVTQIEWNEVFEWNDNWFDWNVLQLASIELRSKYREVAFHFATKQSSLVVVHTAQKTNSIQIDEIFECRPFVAQTELQLITCNHMVFAWGTNDDVDDG